VSGSSTPEHRAPDGRAVDEQPAWRREFPIETAAEGRVNRRQLLACACATGAALLAGEAIHAALAEDPALRLAPRRIAGADDLAVGESLLFAYPDEHDPCVLVRVGPGEHGLVAWSQSCTHLQCPVIPQPERGRLFCPCHKGAFDLATGEPLFGPPRRPLPRIRLARRGDDVYAVGVDG